MFCLKTNTHHHASTMIRYDQIWLNVHQLTTCGQMWRYFLKTTWKYAPKCWQVLNYTGQGAILDLEPFGVWNRIRWLWAVDHWRWRLWRGYFEPWMTWMLNSLTHGLTFEVFAPKKDDKFMKVRRRDLPSKAGQWLVGACNFSYTSRCPAACGVPTTLRIAWIAVWRCADALFQGNPWRNTAKSNRINSLGWFSSKAAQHK